MGNAEYMGCTFELFNLGLERFQTLVGNRLSLGHRVRRSQLFWAFAFLSCWSLPLLILLEFLLNHHEPASLVRSELFNTACTKTGIARVAWQCLLYSNCIRR